MAVKQKKVTRIQVEFTPERVVGLEKLMRRCDLNTKKELFNVALSIFEWAVDETTLGNKVASINTEKEHYEVLRTPALDTIARSLVN